MFHIVCIHDDAGIHHAVRDNAALPVKLIDHHMPKRHICNNAFSQRSAAGHKLHLLSHIQRLRRRNGDAGNDVAEGLLCRKGGHRNDQRSALEKGGTDFSREAELREDGINKNHHNNSPGQIIEELHLQTAALRQKLLIRGIDGIADQKKRQHQNTGADELLQTWHNVGFLSKNFHLLYRAGRTS